jgi:outer membrane biosynthesis protein TonB
MSSDDAPVKKPRSEAQIQALNKARAKALELRTQRNDIRQKHGITDDTDATPEETPTENAETESNSASEDEDEQPPAAVVEKKPKPVKKETKPKTDPAPKPKPQSKPQQREAHVPIPQNFRMMSRNQYILFDE